MQRAKQLAGDMVFAPEATKPVQRKFCVDSEWLKTVIGLGFIPDVDSYEDLVGDDLHTYLESMAAASRDVMTIDILDQIVRQNLKIDMRDKDVRSRIKNLFVSYKSLFRRHGLSWITEDIKKSRFLSRSLRHPPRYTQSPS